MDAKQHLQWDYLRNYALDITDDPCSSDVVTTLDEANFILEKYGLGDDFLNALFSVRDVSGDLPEAETFREQLNQTWTDFAVSVGYVGQTLDNSTIGGYIPHGVAKPVLHMGHKAPTTSDTSSSSAHNASANVVVRTPRGRRSLF
ncbi:hypothetical protein HK405_011094 [Cladochytrium tenue]|nr:hypothetical protein HK405_011094 [Cladochytrium tenue]